MTVILPSTPRIGQSNRLEKCTWKGTVRWMPRYTTKVPVQEIRTYSPRYWHCWQQLGLSCQPLLGTVPTKGKHSPKDMTPSQDSHDWGIKSWLQPWCGGIKTASSPQIRTESPPNMSLCPILVASHSFPSTDGEPKALPNEPPTHKSLSQSQPPRNWTCNIQIRNSLTITPCEIVHNLICPSFLGYKRK